ncbi:MAG: DNA internalization-related competence protein ComEC/Rec2 [Dehalococcoidia bacterium]
MSGRIAYPTVSALAGLSLAWVAGLAAGLWLSLPLPSLLLLALPPVIILVALGLRRHWVLLLALGVLLLLSGALRSGGMPGPGEGLTPYTEDGEQRLQVQVAAAQPWSRGWRLRVNAYQVAEGEGRRAVAGEAYLYLPPYVDYDPGDRLEVVGELGPALRSGRPAMFYPEVKLLETRDGGPGALLHRLRQSLSRGLARALPEPQASLSQALLLGQRGNLPPSLRQDFTRTGTAHLLAISGLHISVLAGIVLSLAAWALGRHRPYYLMVALLLVWLYILLSGFRPPAVRAGIMASLFLWGEGIGRPRAAFTALAFAAAVMVGISPRLLGEASFQLTFAAMAGIVILSPRLQDMGQRLRLPRLAVDGLAYSLGATVAVLPLISHYFGLVPLVGVPATLLAMPALPGAILGSALAGGVAAVAPPLSVPFAGLAWLFLFYLLTVVRTFALLPWFVPFSLSAAGVGACYLVLFMLVAPRDGLPAFMGVFKRPLKTALALYSRVPRKPLSVALLLAAAVVWAGFLSLPSDRLEVSFLEVGRGQAILVQQGGRQVLIDGDPSPAAIAVALGERLPFWDRTIDGIVLTHPDADHLSGLTEVLRRYRVGWAMEPGPPVETRAYEEWSRMVQEEGLTPIAARQGMEIRLGDAVLTVLHPGEELVEGTGDDVDNNGIVLRLEVGEVSFLLTGDLHWEGENELLARGAPLGSTVLQVGHHGSATSTSPAFLAVVSPRVAVVSATPDFPSLQVVERLRAVVGEELYITGERGTVTFSTDGQRLWVKTER